MCDATAGVKLNKELTDIQQLKKTILTVISAVFVWFDCFFFPTDFLSVDFHLL